MLRVLLVDDEPFIIQGLKALIDWKAEGFEIVKTCMNGQEAYDYLKENKVDLIIADIQMPIMTGLELLKRIKEEHISDAFFVVLTGYKDFSYAQTAIEYEAMNYLLKPVEKAELINILRKINNISVSNAKEEQSRKEMEAAYLARNIMALLFGKHDRQNVEYVKNHMQIEGGVYYVVIEFVDEFIMSEDVDETEMRQTQRHLYRACQDYLKEDQGHCIFDVSRDEKSYDIGLLYCEYMGAKREADIHGFLNDLKDYLETAVDMRLRMFVGKKVDEINSISKSYTSACTLKSLEAFRSKKDIYFYESEVSVNNTGVVLCKNSLDDLISSIESKDIDKIDGCVMALFEEFKKSGLSSQTVNLNVNYLLFQLIHLASELDSEIDQEEILRFIGEHSVEDGTMRGDKEHLSLFAREYSMYLDQLRQNVSGGILLDIEKEVRENYKENITLKDLGQKYFVNSSYLGQIFQKKYGLSFKDYLTNYRINESTKLLLNTDMKIVQVAEEVGYKDSDYFVRKFIEINGCTPTKWRKQKA